ncbi:rhodanese-like domain-containing protein [Flavobacterium sp. LaA7.5]|nr:rhodanese-like domain-containing protein [Flavobacterium salilacus subsp. altitudinum]
MKNLSQKEWEEKLASDSNAVVLDVRTENECAHGVLEHAQCLDIFQKDSFLAALGNMDKNKNYYVYCRSGQRSANACQVMEEMGFNETYNLLGGISGWTGKIV